MSRNHLKDKTPKVPPWLQSNPKDRSFERQKKQEQKMYNDYRNFNTKTKKRKVNGFKLLTAAVIASCAFTIGSIGLKAGKQIYNTSSLGIRQNVEQKIENLDPKTQKYITEVKNNTIDPLIKDKYKNYSSSHKARALSIMIDEAIKAFKENKELDSEQLEEKVECAIDRANDEIKEHSTYADKYDPAKVFSQYKVKQGLKNSSS